MTRLGRRIAPGLVSGLAATGLAVLAVGGATRRSGDQAAVSEAAARIDRLLSEAYPSGEPGAAVLVSRAGTVILRKGYGLANTERKAAATAETVFRLASVTKVFTGTSILMLVEQGRLALGAPVTSYLPGYPAPGRGITVGHLLSYTSGLADYLDRPDSMAWARSDHTVQDLTDAFKDRPASFAPGEKNAYSNSNYLLWLLPTSRRAPPMASWTGATCSSPGRTRCRRCTAPGDACHRSRIWGSSTTRSSREGSWADGRWPRATSPSG